MSQSPNPVTNSGSTELSESDRHLLRAVERRRVALDVITSGSGPIFLGELAKVVAERVATEKNVERVAVSLHHNHLPRMEDFGVVDYDPDERLVTRKSASNGGDGSHRDTQSFQYTNLPTVQPARETTMATRDPRSEMERCLSEVSDTDRHRLLSHERRRSTLEVLSKLTAPVELGDLAALVAVQESGDHVSNDEKEASVAITLHQAHLPKMDEIDIIEYNPEEARVEMCPPVAPSSSGYQSE